MKFRLIFALVLLTGGCAEKKALRRTHLPLNSGINIEFRGIKDSRCVIGDVFLNATGGYVVICK